MPEFRINRIRLEFKERIWSARITAVISINRIRLEFKVRNALHFSWSLPVLIESDWNLKGYNSIILFSMILVLIESDWNLKEKHRSLGFCLSRSINRIRLEFKGYDYATVQAEVNRINRIRLEFKVPSPKPELTTLLPY